MSKSACLRWKQALAEYATNEREIPQGSRLAKHLTTCAECARELDWYRAAHRDLQGSLTAERITSDFTDATWERFTATAPPHRSPGIIRALPAIAAIAALALIIARHPGMPSPVDTQSRTAFAVAKPAEKQAVRPLEGTSNSGRSMPRVGIAVAETKKKASDRPHVGRHRGVQRMHSHRMWAHRTPTGAGKQFASNSRMPDFSWERLAAWYEIQGDYRSAATAYDQAARENPTEAHEFNAGRTAECAGDMAQAITYYAHVLTQERKQEPHSNQNPPSDLPPEKGTSQWNDDRYFL